MKQLTLLSKPPSHFGGDLLSDPKRSQRILSTKKPTHLVLKSKPTFQLFKNKNAIKRIIEKLIPFTRVLEWGRSFKTLKNYILQNELEVNGLIPYQKRKHKYRTKADEVPL